MMELIIKLAATGFLGAVIGIAIFVMWFMPGV